MERSYGVKLEQKCLTPGHWHIEGYCARKRRNSTLWVVSDRCYGPQVFVVTTLTEVRDKVRDIIN